jgi:hypothetical protein
VVVRALKVESQGDAIIFNVGSVLGEITITSGAFVNTRRAAVTIAGCAVRLDPKRL